MRKTLEVTIPDTATFDRDRKKRFLLTEMSSYHAEMWAMRALMGMGANGVSLPDGIMRLGMAGMVIVGLDGLMRISFETAEPLLREMMACVQYVQERGGPRDIDDAHGADIEEIATRLYLRDKVFELHTGFLVADAIREMLASAERKWSSESTPISPDPSA